MTARPFGPHRVEPVPAALSAPPCLRAGATDDCVAGA
jgi:hypothetical protein